MSHNAKPVTIRGITYPSGRAAALALGLCPDTVTKAAKRGTLDFVGLGPRGSKGRSHRGKPIIIQGVRYPSQRIAAEVLGVHQATVSQAKRQGWLDRLGTKQSKLK